MNKSVICHRCDFEFILNTENIQTITRGELEIQYSICPQCGCKSHVLTSDAEMRKLIALREQIAQKYKLAIAKHFRKEYYEKLEREFAAVKNQQFKIYPRLKRLGIEILRKDDIE